MGIACEIRIVIRTFSAIVTFMLTGNVFGYAQSPQPIPIQDQYLQVYVKMHDAENLEKKGDLKTAYEEYFDCKKTLNDMRKTDPQGTADLFMFKPNLLDRINDKLVEVKKKMDDSPPASNSKS